MTHSDKLPNISLPKWARMVVDGDNVTSEQAAEIIIRTSDLHFFSNDRSWTRQLNEVLGVSDDGKQLERAENELGVIHLYYLQNYQIASANIQGPYGWCSWDGKIGCDYNIGKWPRVESVLEEWQTIAKEWRFLNLRCQVWNIEKYFSEDNCSSDEDYVKPSPVVEYIVKDGNVTLCKPKETLHHNRSNSFMPENSPILNPYAERGCTLSQFKNAVKLAKQRIQNKEQTETE